jgi:hypothetical protein
MLAIFIGLRLKRVAKLTRQFFIRPYQVEGNVHHILLSFNRTTAAFQQALTYLLDKSLF